MAHFIFNPLNLLLLMFMAPPDITVHVGPLNFPIYRIYILLMTPICTVKYLFIRKTPVDFLILAYIGWGVIALFWNHGTTEWQYAGILFIETATPYLIARIYIANQPGFESFVKTYFILVLLILPFAIYETLTGHHLLRDISRKVMGYSPMIGRPARMGFERAYGPFEHPIHYGFFCSAILGLVLGLKGSVTGLGLRWFCIAIAVFSSMSSGPLLSLMLQNILKIWDYGTRWLVFRWRILAAIFAALYVMIDLLSNRTPFHVLVSYGTFRLASAYNRIHIWNFGSASVAKHPVFGIGLGDWERAAWMSSSMDNFWLLTSVRYGLPAFAFLSLAIATLFLLLARKSVGPQVNECRKGWCISLVALIIAGCTVHFWTALYCLFFIMLGASTWILHAPETATEAAPQTSAAQPGTPQDRRTRVQPLFSRFPKPHPKQRPITAGIRYSRNLTPQLERRSET